MQNVVITQSESSQKDVLLSPKILIIYFYQFHAVYYHIKMWTYIIVDGKISSILCP